MPTFKDKFSQITVLYSEFLLLNDFSTNEIPGKLNTMEIIYLCFYNMRAFSFKAWIPFRILLFALPLQVFLSILNLHPTAVKVIKTEHILS